MVLQIALWLRSYTVVLSLQELHTLLGAPERRAGHLARSDAVTVAP